MPAIVMVKRGAMRHRRVEWRYPNTVLALCLAAYFAIRFAQLIISPVIPVLIDDFGITRAGIGAALTGMWAVYAFSQLPSGVFADHYGERRVVVIALALAGAAILAASAAPAFPVFFAFVLLLGVGAGLYYNAATALLTRLHEEIGRAVGTHRIGSQVAGLVAPALAAALVGLGWRPTLVVGGVVPFVVLAGFLWLVRPTQPIDPGARLRESVSFTGLWELLRRPPIAFATTIAILGEFTLLATMSFLPTFLVQHHGFSLAVGGLLFSAYFAVVAVGQPASGWLSDRLGRDPVLGMAMFAGAIGYFVLVAGVGPRLVVIPGVVLVGFGMSWGSPLQSRVMDDLDADDRGIGFGLVRTLYILVGAAGNTVVGATADLWGWGIAFGVLGGLLVVATGLVLANRLFRLGW